MASQILHAAVYSGSVLEAESSGAESISHTEESRSRSHFELVPHAEE